MGRLGRAFEVFRRQPAVVAIAFGFTCFVLQLAFGKRRRIVAFERLLQRLFVIGELPGYGLKGSAHRIGLDAQRCVVVVVRRSRHGRLCGCQPLRCMIEQVTKRGHWNANRLQESFLASTRWETALLASIRIGESVEDFPRMGGDIRRLRRTPAGCTGVRVRRSRNVREIGLHVVRRTL